MKTKDALRTKKQYGIGHTSFRSLKYDIIHCHKLVSSINILIMDVRSSSDDRSSANSDAQSHTAQSHCLF